MIVRKLQAVRKSDRNVQSKQWDSARLLLKDDNMGFSFHVTTMYAGEELHMHYQNHLEAVLVLKGTGTIEDLGAGVTHQLAPGVMYALNAHDKHVVRPVTDILCACVFNPPVTGREVHDESGAYPAAANMVREGELTS
ncbi:L-ectoine synthase [Sphingobium wenxiniae]|uniref:L-ectoine synthase n=2 Tax=Sphingobium TaxID=165695 RepID=T0HXC2_9SPHN|nr:MULTISPECIES: ectoine synthase [Sphingobium]EQB03980.1 ectoine synthase [Sphingobium baderi LL03]KMS62838.1 ectoine synthase [Sphingobium baderi LL03]MBB6189904.1 L-ectoine synthase [Sphingobium wenxiniae]TWH97775.1 ectoine synthase [Sphingobium wenxiniae]WRD77021.1 ectoine synthase [Sphingobium baderi]